MLKNQECSELIQRVTHSIDSVESIDIDRVLRDVREFSIARITGILDRQSIRRSYESIRDGFDQANDRKHDPRDTEAPRSNYQKLQIGGNSGMDTRRTLGRFLRILYNPIFRDDIYGLRDAFIKVSRLRNKLYGLPDDFAVEGTTDGLFTCARIHQYPRGGGFMVPHRDLFSRLATNASDLSYFQVFFLITEKGTDYQKGGGYIELDEKRYLFEDYTLAGDIVIYDGRTMHGVEDIDPLHPLELDQFGGRAAGFVSLFKHLQGGGNEYAKMSTEAVEKYISNH